MTRFQVTFEFMIAINDGQFSYPYVKPVVEIDLVNSAHEHRNMNREEIILQKKN